MFFTRNSYRVWGCGKDVEDCYFDYSIFLLLTSPPFRLLHLRLVFTYPCPTQPHSIPVLLRFLHPFRYCLSIWALTILIVHRIFLPYPLDKTFVHSAISVRDRPIRAFVLLVYLLKSVLSHIDPFSHLL